MDKFFKRAVQKNQAGWRRTVVKAIQFGIPTPCFSSALAYFDDHLSAKSAACLSFAVSAARGGYVKRLRRRLAEVERLYLEGLMKTRDANEGLQAFIARRSPRWEHR